MRVVVIGAGHAGIEAALASARMGVPTTLVTLSLGSIGRMSCNPAIGGLGKGQIVREIDALGGEMARAADATGIQFRMLNRSKGPAVWSPRAQCDKFRYAQYMQRVVLEQENLTVVEDVVEEILVDAGRVRGARGRKGEYPARCVVVTTGTFLKALMHCGELKTPGGRLGEGSAERLSDCLRRLGFELGRLKTGTPPRLLRGSIAFDALERQAGDPEPEPFSFFTETFPVQPQVECWITYTSARTHEIVRANLHRAPMYSGQIRSRGPRYCPSFEDKVVRFADKDRHQIFLEPEGLDSESIYCNGISTSTPPDVQEAFVRTIPGLERAEFLRYGYAVEYDFAYPHQLRPTLETKRVDGLFFAGQINGTSGYEEAAGQGLVAGINAARKVLGEPPLVLDRSEAYIGVMIDDLTTKSELVEPYRMFTSLAEYRLILRSDNAFRRLMRKGLVKNLSRLDLIEQGIADLREYLRRTFVGTCSLEQLLRRPEHTLRTLAELRPEIRRFFKDPKIAEQVEIEVKYEGYIARQQREVERFRRMEDKRIPEDFDYAKVRHLRFEAREKLNRYRPYTLGQASRITGISPADIQILMLHLHM